MIVLVTAPALRLKSMDQTGIDVFLHRLTRDVAVALGLDRAFAQLGSQGAGPGDKLICGRNFPRCGGRLRFGETHGTSSECRKVGLGMSVSSCPPPADEHKMT